MEAEEKTGCKNLKNERFPMKGTVSHGMINWAKENTFFIHHNSLLKTCLSILSTSF